MASTMLHYIISSKVAENINIKDLNMFLLGAAFATDTGNKEDGSYHKLHYLDTISEKGIKGFNFSRYAAEHADKMNDDYHIGYCCHIMQDALWFHNVCHPFVRVYDKEIKIEKNREVYRDYMRLNYLLQKEHDVVIVPPKFSKVPDKEIDPESLLRVVSNFNAQIAAPPCAKEDLELLNWDVITDYIDKAVSFCTREISHVLDGTGCVDAEKLYVETL